MQDYALLQEALTNMSKKEAIEHLQDLFPHLTTSWIRRNLAHLMNLDPDGFHELLVHNDPTARKAINNIMKEQVAA